MPGSESRRFSLEERIMSLGAILLIVVVPMLLGVLPAATR
jgi:hypothetical protein